jgi:hypothetical protein
MVSGLGDLCQHLFPHRRRRWRRTGGALARPAVVGEEINSLEGPQTTSAGDWVIRGPKGEEWVTRADHFAYSYEISEPSSHR